MAAGGQIVVRDSGLARNGEATIESRVPSPEARLPQRPHHPSAREVVRHRDAKEDQQPDKARNGDDPRQARAPAHAHEDEDDERRFVRAMASITTLLKNPKSTSAAA